MPGPKMAFHLKKCFAFLSFVVFVVFVFTLITLRRKEMKASFPLKRKDGNGINNGAATVRIQEGQTELFWKAANETVVIAKTILEKKVPVLVTLINDAYLPFVYSWLCNTMYMNIHDQVLFITTDAMSKLKLNRDWPTVRVIALPEDDDLLGDQSYSRVGYVKLMVKRTEVLHALLQNNVEMLLFEVDCLWLADPIPECKRHAQTNDVVVTVIANKKNAIAGGFIYMRTTPRTKKLWSKLTERMRRLGREIEPMNSKRVVSEAKNDQMFLMNLIQQRFGGIKYKVLPWDRYTDGKWYGQKLEKRSKVKPVIINNNWVVGNHGKMERAKKYGHWFVRDDLTCDTAQLNRTIIQGKYM